MDKKMLTIILAVVLIGCFFLPYISIMGMSASGLDTVKGPGDWEKYIPALIPLSGVMLLIGALNNGNYIGGRGLWTWLPLLTVIYMIVRPLMDKVPFDVLLKMFGVGFWVTVAASLALAFYNPRKA